MTGQTLCNQVSIFLVVLLVTLFVGFHIALFGITFGTRDTVYIGAGILALSGAVYAMIRRRGMREVSNSDAFFFPDTGKDPRLLNTLTV